DGPVSRIFQIQRYATFTALEKRIGICLPRGTIRRIDMYYVGALIRKHDAGERSSNVLAEVDHAQTVQCAHAEIVCATLARWSERYASRQPDLPPLLRRV